MTLVSTIAKELLGLFVDDGSLALAILAWIGCIAVLASAANPSTYLVGGLLFAGLLAILAESVLRRSRKP